MVALALCCALIGGAAGAGGAVLGSRYLTANGNASTVLEGRRESTVIQTAHIDTGREMTPAEVYAANVNSTVGITTSVTTNFWGVRTSSAASGSGFIITEDGYILTNFHVIENSDAITVTLYNGEKYEAELVGYDESNDIAVLKVEAEGLTPVVLGDSGNMNVGDTVIAIGNPLGELTFSLTSGAVSALNREVTFSSGVTMDLIQTDCAINSGNSGGALFNLYGEVIGITNAKYSGSGSGSEASVDNICFAIPVNHVKGIVKSIIENGFVARPYIGVSVTDVNAEALAYGLPEGAAVKSVTGDSPAGKAGLQVNDIITQVNGTPVSGSGGLVDLVGECESGERLTLSVYRQGEFLELTVEVGEQVQPALPEAEAETAPQQPWSNYPGGFGWY